jgi:uncharacterized protein (DUF2141 family)
MIANKAKYTLSTVMMCLIFMAILVTACSTKTDNSEQKTTTATANDISSAAQDTIAETDSLSDNITDEIIPLTVTIKNLESVSAPVWITFYKAEHEFLSLTDIYKTYKLNPDGKTLVASIEDLKFGEYAIATFQDLNNNGKIDKKVVMPTEPYGFSNNYKPTIRAPRFSNCKFTYSKEKHDLSISMIWK